MDSPPRKATISQIDALGRLGLVYADSGIGGPPLARPFVGGASSGFHSAPQQGDQVLVHHEHPWRPAAVTSMAAHPESLTPLNPGESAIYHPDGRVLSYAKSDGTTTVWSKPGKPSTTVDTNGVWTHGGISGVATLDANGHVQQQAVYDASEAQTNDTLSSSSTIVNNLDRIRYQEQQIQGTTHWNDAPPATLQDVAAAMGTFPNAQRVPSLAATITPTHGVDTAGWVTLVRDRYLAISSGSAGYVDLYDVGNPGSPAALTSINAASPQSLAATTVGALVPFNGGKDLLLSYGKSGAQAGTNGGLQLWSMPAPGSAPSNLWYSDQGASLTGPICASGPIIYQQGGAYPGTTWAGYAIYGESILLGPTSGMTGYPTALEAVAQNERVYMANGSTVVVAQMTLSNATLSRVFSGTVSGLYDVCGVALTGQGYLLCADNDGTTLDVLNVANDNAPSRVGFAGGSTAIARTGRRGVAAFGQYAAVCNGPNNRVDIYSVKTPTAPVLLTSITLPASASPRGLQLLGGNYLAVAGPGTNAVYVYNLWGVDAATARVGSLRAGRMQVAHNLEVVGRSQFGSGIDASGGLNVEGGLGAATLNGSNIANGVVALSANSLPQLRLGGTPTVTANAGLGSSPTISLQAGSTDACGVVNFTVGTSPSGSTQFTLTFSTTLAAAPKVVLTGFQGANVGLITVTSATTTQLVFASNGFTAGASYGVSYLVVA